MTDAFNASFVGDMQEAGYLVSKTPVLVVNESLQTTECRFGSKSIG